MREMGCQSRIPKILSSRSRIPEEKNSDDPELREMYFIIKVCSLTSLTCLKYRNSCPPPPPPPRIPSWTKLYSFLQLSMRLLAKSRVARLFPPRGDWPLRAPNPARNHGFNSAQVVRVKITPTRNFHAVS